jgi:hypothetical protein
MGSIFQAISRSWVAPHPTPQGVVEFLGGAFFGTFPRLAYSHFLRSLYEAGYTVITLPFPFGFDHGAIAENLLIERDRVLQQLDPSHQEIPRFWIGHSLGCKYILLLEAAQKIWNQPSLLIAPDISDTQDAVPIPGLGQFLDRIHRGVRPNRRDTQRLLQEKKDGLFNLTALIAFEEDRVAGQSQDSPEASDVAWFVQTLDDKPGVQLIQHTLPGNHTEIVGVRFYRRDGSFAFVDLDFADGFFEPPQARGLESTAIACLGQLLQRLQQPIKSKSETASAAQSPPASGATPDKSVASTPGLPGSER